MRCVHCGRDVSRSYNKGKRASAMQCPYCGKNPNSVGKQMASGFINSGGGARLVGTVLKEIMKGLF